MAVWRMKRTLEMRWLATAALLFLVNATPHRTEGAAPSTSHAIPSAVQKALEDRTLVCLAKLHELDKIYSRGNTFRAYRAEVTSLTKWWFDVKKWAETSRLDTDSVAFKTADVAAGSHFFATVAWGCGDDI